MIKTERGIIEIKGGLCETLADYRVITVTVRKVLEETIGKEKAEEEMQKAMQLSRMSEEERDKYFEKEIAKKSERFAESIRKIIADRK